MADIRGSLKRLVLYAGKVTGGLRLCREMTARGLRILCYHGVSLLDEHEFQGKLFMRPELFRRRMEWLIARGFQILPLAKAVEDLYRGTLPDRAVVLTFDDGWYGTYRHALPVLSELGIPATIYVTTYYVERRSAVFDVAVGYLLWRGRRTHINLSAFGRRLEGQYQLREPFERRAATDAISTQANAKLSGEERNAFLYDLAIWLGIDPDHVGARRLCGLMTTEEIALAAAAGFDIQLHTHRHTLSTDDHASVVREITDNLAVLAPLVRRPLTHLAYPDGVWHPQILPWLKELGIETATTTRRGLNYLHCNRLALCRFLDGENIAPIEFEAELEGGLEALRRLRGSIEPRRSHAVR